MPNLYELASQYRKFYDFLEEALENEEIPVDDLEMYFDTLDSIQDSFEQKAENVVKFLKNIQGDIEAYKAEKLRLERKQKILQNKFDGLKQWLKDSLELNKIDKVKAGMFTIRLQSNPLSVQIVDEEKVPNQFIVKKEITFDKKAILEKLKAGEKVDGATFAPPSKHVRFG